MRKSRRVNHALKVAREALASKRASANAEEEESKHEGAINYMDQSDHDIELTSLDLRQVPDDSIEPPVRFRSAAPMKQQIPAKNLVGGAIVSGLGYTQMKKVFAFADIKICASSTFYEAQNRMLPIIEHEVTKNR